MSFAYNVLSDLTSRTDAKSQTSTFTYDNDNRPLRRVEPDLTSLWQFDSGGVSGTGTGKPYKECNASTCSAASYQRSFSYNALGQASAVAIKVDGTTYTYGLSYDSASGRVSTVSYPSGFVAKYDYNAYGYLADIKDNGTGAAIWTANARDAEMKLLQSTTGNGIVTTNAYDGATDRLLSICASTTPAPATATAPISPMTGTRWATSPSVTTPTKASRRSSATTPLNRLTDSATGASCTATTGHVAMAYDAGGNLLKKSDVCGTTACMAYGGAGAGPHALTAITGTVNGLTNPLFTYDNNGNVTGGTRPCLYLDELRHGRDHHAGHDDGRLDV